jgi:hypothetical protein
VTAAVDLCGADSAGISIEQGSDPGVLSLDCDGGRLLRFSERNLIAISKRLRPVSRAWASAALHRLSKVLRDTRCRSPLVTDGILLPWKTEDTRSTIFVMAHGRTEAFAANAVRLMTMLADFAAMGYRQQKQHAHLIAQAIGPVTD